MASMRLTIDVRAPDAHEQVRAVLTAPGSPWEDVGVAPSEIAVSTISGGITNALYKCDAPPAVGRPPVLVRVYGEKTELIINREKDNAVFQLLAKSGIGVPFLGLFGNGRFEGYVDARPLEPAEMGSRAPVDLLAAIAGELSRLHQLDAPGLPGHPGAPVLWSDYLDPWLEVARAAAFDAASPDAGEARKAAMYAALDMPRVAASVGWLRTVLPSPANGHGQALLAARARELGAADPAGGEAAGGEPTPPPCRSAVARLVGDLRVPRAADPLAQARLDAAALAFSVVFGHNDMLSGNVLVSDGGGDGGAPEGGAASPTVPRGAVKLIDYEYAGFNYLCFDVANHFCEHCGFDFHLAQYPAAAAQGDWFRAYLAARGAGVPSRATYAAPAAGGGEAGAWAAGRDGEDDVSAAFLEELSGWTNRAAPLSDAFWGLWAVLQARHSAIDFDFIAYAQRRLGALHGHVAEFWGDRAGY